MIIEDEDSEYNPLTTPWPRSNYEIKAMKGYFPTVRSERLELIRTDRTIVLGAEYRELRVSQEVQK
jgi:hypothetical protein